MFRAVITEEHSRLFCLLMSASKRLVQKWIFSAEIVVKVATLNQTSREDFQPPISALQGMHQNISSLLGLMKERNFTELHQNATLELK